MYALVACSDAQESGTRPVGPDSLAATAVPVAAVRLAPEDLQRELRLSSVVRAQEQVRLAARTSGSLLAVSVEEGDRVRKGQLLARVDVAEQQAQLARAQALVAEAEQQYRRMSELRQRALVSETDYEAATATLRVAQSERQVWRTRVDFGRVEAPLDAVVLQRHVRPGDSVEAQQALFELADLQRMVLHLPVSELDVVHVQPGLAMDVEFDALPGLRLPGSVRRVFPGADAGSRLVTVELALPESAHEQGIRPGFLARVQAVLERREATLSVPALAVAGESGAYHVLRVRDDLLERQPVRTGLRLGDWVEIVDGLVPGDVVLATGPGELQPGQRVRVVSWRSRPSG